ncbi:DEAD/DEAH box helicase [Candidatus Micrarchaeota archaeon]|nr:DEAD/DEAH box helicase [Candidatus Micrarchaeota archaeon]
MGFRKMQLSGQTVSSLEKMGYLSPTEVQQKAIPLILQGENIIVRSQTGTGKTAAFGIGIIEQVAEGSGRKVLVLAPTRELAVQIGKEVSEIGSGHGIKVAVVYGGQKIEQQERKLQHGVEVLVATPGRLLDHEERGNVNLSEYGIVVLDEADRMLDMGFKDEMDRIMKGVPEKRTVLLFSATLDELIMELAEGYMRGPAEILEVGEKERAEKIEEEFVYIARRKKYPKLRELLKAGAFNKALIFMSTKRGVDYLYERLREDGFRADGIHGDMNQGKRERVLEGFKEGKIKILVASDVAARGIHVEDIELIINYDEAQDADTHLHRIGRTGRMGKAGRAITFVETPEEEERDRNRVDHPDFAWMRRGGDPFRGSFNGPRGDSSRGRGSSRDSRRSSDRGRPRGEGGSGYSGGSSHRSGSGSRRSSSGERRRDFNKRKNSGRRRGERKPRD